MFGSVTVVRFGCREPAASSFVEFRPARLRRVVLNGQELDPGRLRGNRLPLAGLHEVNELRVEADMAYSRGSAGLHRFTDPADGETYLAVHAGLDSAQRVFAAFDQPDLKAPIIATVTAPGSWTVLGNGVARPAGLSGAPDRIRWELAATPPISSYLFTMAAGPWYSLRSKHRGIPFGLHSRRSLGEALDRDADEIFAITRACFDRYLEIFAEPYPFDSYDQAFVPELEAGAVENPGCVTFRDEFLFPSNVTRAERQTRGMVIAHEMAHMWFGDLVTMAWWNDVWLSESFATYLGFEVLSEATAFTGAWSDFALARKPRGYDADQRASAHPVAPGPDEVPDTDAALSAYDDISYAKGASVLRQLVAWTGWPAFIAGLNDYLARYRFGSATLDDLLDCLSRASGADLDGWAARWLRTAGVDTLAVRRDSPGAGLVTHDGSRPHRVWIGVYDRAPGDAGELVLRARLPVGAIGRPGIEREAGRDTTFAGQQSAARCRAALPGLDAKRAAWTQMFGPAPAGEPSSYLLAATAEGFWQADQADLVARYVPRYFPALADVTERRGPAVARLLVQHGFPHHTVTAATLRAGEEVLASTVFPASLRRLLADRLDDCPSFKGAVPWSLSYHQIVLKILQQVNECGLGVSQPFY